MNKASLTGISQALNLPKYLTHQVKRKILFIGKIAILALSLISLSCDIIDNNVSIYSLCKWLCAIILSCLLLTKPTPPSNNKVIELNTGDLYPLAWLIFLGLVILAWFSNIPTHFHQDEFILAYASFLLPSIEELEWFSGFPKDYLAKFPVFWFALQKPFFYYLGNTIWAVRISTWPYYALLIVTLFALGKQLLGRNGAFACCAIFIVLAPNLYLSSFGLQNIASTLFFVLAILMLFRVFAAYRWQHEAWLGFACGFAFLNNPASYITYPLIGSVMLIEAARKWSLIPMTSLARASLPCLVILTPFIIHAIFIENFFVQRIQQVNIFSGTWSDRSQQIELGISIWNVISNQLINAVHALYSPGIGGLGGFSYGGQAFLDPITASLFGISLLYLIYRLSAGKDIYAFYILIMFSVPFILGFVLTIHPPPFHRLAIIYPLFALILVIMGRAAINCLLKPYRKRMAIAGLLTLLSSNVLHAWHMVDEEKHTHYSQDTRILGDYFNTHLQQGSEIEIAAFPSFHFRGELLFRTVNRFSINQDSAPVILNQYDGNKPLIILNMPEDTRLDLLRRFPMNTFMQNFNGESLSGVVLFMPPI